MMMIIDNYGNFRRPDLAGPRAQEYRLLDNEIKNLYVSNVHQVCVWNDDDDASHTSAYVESS